MCFRSRLPLVVLQRRAGEHREGRRGEVRDVREDRRVTGPAERVVLAYDRRPSGRRHVAEAADESERLAGVNAAIEGVIEFQAVDLLEIADQYLMVLLAQSEELLDSPTARPYRVRIAENCS